MTAPQEYDANGTTEVMHEHNSHHGREAGHRQQASEHAHHNGRYRKEQRFPPSTHLYMQGRLSNVYLSWQGKTNLFVIPHQRVFKLTEFYPMDLGFLFQEIYSMMEQKRVNNFTMHVFKRDWEVAPHLFIKLGMSQDAYASFCSMSHLNTGYLLPVARRQNASNTQNADALNHNGPPVNAETDRPSAEQLAPPPPPPPRG
eukprot:5911998-Pleurochrysis_carterae.AAC.1